MGIIEKAMARGRDKYLAKKKGRGNGY